MALSRRLLALGVAGGILVALAWGLRGDGIGSTATAPDVLDLPEITDARVVLDTRFPVAVRASYCFESWSSDPERRPAQLHIAVDNVRDDLPPLALGWPLKSPCGTITHPVSAINQPYELRYAVGSRSGARSASERIALAELPELSRKPELPRVRAKLIVDDENRTAVRISYCFSSLPEDPSTRPERLPVTLISTSNEHEGRGYDALVTGRCGTFSHPVLDIDPPYVISYMAVSDRETKSARATIPVR